MPSSASPADTRPVATRTLPMTLRRKSDDSVIAEEHLQLEPADVELLRSYAAQVGALETLRLFRTEPVPRLQRLSCTRERGLVFEFAEADKEDVFAALHMARPLLLEREPASLIRVIGLLGRCANGPHLRQQLKRLRARYAQSWTGQHVELSVGDAQLLTSEAFWLWLNGAQYHRDHDKRMRLQPLEEALGEDTLFKLMLNHFMDKTDVIRQLQHEWVAEILVKFDAEPRAA